MNTAFLNTSSVGWTEDALALRSCKELFPQLLHFVGYRLDTKRRIQIVGKVALVGLSDHLVRELNVATDGGVFRKHFKPGCNFDAFVLTCGVRQKDYSRGSKALSGCQVNKGSIWTLPNGMEFRFEPDLFDFEDSPAEYLAAAVSSNMLWHDRETFLAWLVRQGLEGDINRLLSGGDVSAK